MNESMPKFEKEQVSEEENPGFKVEDKRRIDMEKVDREVEDQLARKKAEKERKTFDAMTPEQREEWEYNRDKEKGFKVVDKMGQIRGDIVEPDKFKSKKVEDPDEAKRREEMITQRSRQRIEDLNKLEDTKKFIENFGSEPEVAPAAPADREEFSKLAQSVREKQPPAPKRGLFRKTGKWLADRFWKIEVHK